MNSGEVDILLNSKLSLPARIVYSVYIISCQDNGFITIDYAHIRRTLLVIPDPNQTNAPRPYDPDFSQISIYIEELIRYQLLEQQGTCRYEHFYDHMTFRLPYRQPKCQTFNPQLFRMHTDWRPDQNYEEQARLAGLINKDYSLLDINNFISYWIGRNDYLDSYHWNLKFIQYLKYSKRQ